MADPTGDLKTHLKLESNVSILVHGQGQENCANSGKVRNHLSNNLIRSCCIDQFLKVGRNHYNLALLPRLQLCFTIKL